MAKDHLDSFEKLGLFYLGKKVDPGSGGLSDQYLLYDSADLTTHAVCVGMTGSGKTGLCISILEEAAIDNIPSIIIDPKGDLGNLLLAFPAFRGEDFLPWINTDEAQKKGVTTQEYAGEQAALWKDGLAKWDQDGSRIERFRSASDFTIYTPGSSAGVPVSIIDSLSAPRGQKLEDLDLLRERIQTTVSGLLGLLGIDADPLQSREHILISNIIEHRWTNGKDLKLGDLIRLIQSPPIQQVGVFNIEDFFPAADRTKLAMTMNNLLAAPAFKSWMEGQPLDIDHILYTKEGKPCTAIFSIAHLADSERMFFVTLLLNQIIGWMRSRSGSTSLRALLYMDEVFGFLPPVSEPPSKKPLLTMLKQARAFGVGVILATQNPVDLDYKGLSNAGTWFIGRLQTERDKERLADGLIRGDAGDIFDKTKLMEKISSLSKRQFLLHNVHEKQPEIFQTRWVLSYLCGPLTRSQISLLMKNKSVSTVTIPKDPISDIKPGSSVESSTVPQAPAAIRQYFARIDQDLSEESSVQYYPFLTAAADISVFNNAHGVAQTDTISRALALAVEQQNAIWDNAREISFQTDQIENVPPRNGSFSQLPAYVSRVSFFETLDKTFETHLYQTYTLKLFKNQALKIISKPGESERDFTIRLREVAQQQREFEKERLKRSFEKKVQALEKQIVAAETIIGRESDQYQERILDTAISVGSTLLGAFLGGRSARTGVTRAARSASQIRKEKQDVERARTKLEKIKNEISEVDRQFERQMNNLAEEYETKIADVQELHLRPKKSDIIQKFFALVWVPYQKDPSGQTKPVNGMFV